MSLAFRCDRCGDYEDDKPVAEVSFKLPTPTALASGSSQRREDQTDLCAKCLASLQEWRDYYKSNPKGAA